MASSPSMRENTVIQHLHPCIDHIAISKRILGRAAEIIIDEWNLDKKLSDHKGIAVTIRG